MPLNHDQLFEYINKEYDTHIIPTLEEYVKIPNQSPYFDPGESHLEAKWERRETDEDRMGYQRIPWPSCWSHRQLDS